MVESEVKFAKLTDDQREDVSAIVARAGEKWPELDRLTLWMDLTAVQAEMPLRLNEFAKAEGFDFAHDIFGITNHMDRETGILGDCFVPRFAI